MFYRIDVPAYFSTRTNTELAANSFLVNGAAAAEKHMLQIANQGGQPVAVELTAAAEYRAAAMAKMGAR